MIPASPLGRRVAFVLALLSATARADDPPPAGRGPAPDEQQLPLAMHSAMTNRPKVTVGHANADIVGTDNRALQAAVDYVAGLGGGAVEIGPGEYLMRDSLHLRSNVTVRGTKGRTVLRKADAAVSALSLDGDFGEQQLTLANADGFAPGIGLAVWDKSSGGFHTTVGRITGKRDHTVAIDAPLMADCLVSNGAQAATVFAVVSGRDIQGARVEDLVIEGNRKGNPPLNGCRGGGIYLYRGFGTVIRGCVVRDYPGDGISFQQSNDVQVLDCLVEKCAELGIHPGSGSQRAVVKGCTARNNGADGLFLCWRVRHGAFVDNVLEGNGRFGISIGHKDSDNLLRGNRVVRNASNGIFFRLESEGMSPHRNRLEANVIEDNGREPGTAAIRIRGEPSGLVFRSNQIRDTRDGSARTQTVGVLIEEKVGPVDLDPRDIEAAKIVQDRRPAPTGTKPRD